MSKIAERLKLLMSEENINNVELMNCTGISKNQIGKYLSGFYEPSLQNALLISKYFNCSLDYLVGLEDEINTFGKFGKPNVGKFLLRYKELLIKNKTNHSQICTLLKFNRNNLVYWKQKQTFPSLDILYRLASTLNTSIEYLIGRI